jgi:hypothetical protein
VFTVRRWYSITKFDANSNNVCAHHNMAQLQNVAIANIQEYAKDARELQDNAMDFDASNIEARLEQTVRDLQTRVHEQQAALEKVWLYHCNTRTMLIST